MQFLTKQEQMVLIVVISMLLLGLAVKVYRTSTPPERAQVGAAK